MSLEYRDLPSAAGLYVAYTNDAAPNARYAEMILLFWNGRYWSHHGSIEKYPWNVYRCIGPLPALELTDDSD